MLAVGFISYLIGDLYTSGVVSIITTALMFAMYGWYNLSDQGKYVSGISYKMLAYTMEALVFAKLGIGLINST